MRRLMRAVDRRPSRSGLVKGRELLLGELELGGTHVLLEMLQRGGPGDRADDRRASQQPGERDLGRRGVAGAGDGVEPSTGLGEVPDRERPPGEEGDPLPLTGLEDIIRLPVGEVVAVLDGDDRNDRLRPRELLQVDVREADVADLPLLPQTGELADRLLERNLRVGSVQLVEVDPLQPQAPQATLARLAEGLGAAVGRPPAGPDRKSTRLNSSHLVISYAVVWLQQ